MASGVVFGIWCTCKQILAHVALADGVLRDDDADEICCCFEGRYGTVYAETIVVGTIF